jgi:hypothetical protein
MEAVQKMDMDTRLDIADMEEEKLRGSIRRIFYSDQLQLQEGPQMTAYEVQVRYELMQRILGPTLGRFRDEFLNPLIEFIFFSMLEAGALGEPPDTIVALGEMPDVEYLGPLARAQKLADSMALDRFFALALPIFQAKPETLDTVDLDAALRIRQEATGAPERLMVDPDKVKAIRAARAQASEQQAQLEQATQIATAAAPAAKAFQALSGGQQQ